MSNVNRILFSLALLNSACLFADTIEETDTLSNTPDSAFVTSGYRDRIVKREPIEHGPSEEKPCISDARPYMIEMRHIEGRGIGYSKGYTTLEWYYMPTCGHFTPILDVRGHVFDDGKFAANAGIGFRYLNTRVWGVNAYYDYRQAKKEHYNQVSLGLESLGRWVDYRINGYVPVGERHSKYYHTRFRRFKGNNIILSRKREFAMSGANAEIGVHMYDKKFLNLYGTIGPYYFGGEGRNAWGGQARLSATIYDRVRIQGSTSYDSVYKWIGQGELSLNFAFGPKKKIKKLGSKSCCHESIMAERAVQRIERDEIIVVNHKHKHTKAINPATGLPYFVVFVDNTSSSNGTFESPYSTFLTAQTNSNPNDVIYVFPGDGTTNGMNNGITLKNGQMLLGSGIAHTIGSQFGSVTIPAQTPNSPSITAPTNNVVVTAANNNLIAGFNISSFGNTGVFANNVANIIVKDNIFLSNGTGGAVNYLFVTNALVSNNTCITEILGGGFTNCFGSIIVENNRLFIVPGGTGFGVGNSIAGFSNIVFSKNIITGGVNGFQITPSGTATMNISLLQNSISNTTSDGISCQTTNSSTLQLTAVDNGVNDIKIQTFNTSKVFLGQ